jgi:hypothetical protein
MKAREYPFLIHANEFYLPDLSKFYKFHFIGFHMDTLVEGTFCELMEIVMSSIEEYNNLLEDVKSKGLKYNETQKYWDPCTVLYLPDYHLSFYKDEYDIWKFRKSAEMSG